MNRQNFPRFEAREEKYHDLGVALVAIWDTTNNYMLDCWWVQDRGDYSQVINDIREIFS